MLDFTTECEREYFELERRAFWAVLHNAPKPTRRDYQRRDELKAYLLKTPPDGYPYRCRHCMLGTHDPDHECLGCRFG